jgi:hypothetical protein
MTSPVVWWIGLYVMYVVGCIALNAVLAYFLGTEKADEVMFIPGLGIRPVYEAVVLVIRIVQAPWVYRDRRLFRETFDIDPRRDQEIVGSIVNENLVDRAKNLRYHFSRQENLRKVKTPEAADELVEVNRTIQVLKGDYKHAHAIACKFGFSSPEWRWNDYLEGDLQRRRQVA